VSIEGRQTKKGDRRYDVRLRRLDGTVYTRTFRTRKEAEAFERAERTARDRGTWTDPNAGAVTFAVYAEEWIDTRTVRGRRTAPRTTESYRYLLSRYLLPTFAAMPLTKITPQAVRAWHTKLIRTAPTSVAPKSYRLLHAILTTATADSVIGANPCRIKGAGSERTGERPTLGTAEVTALAESIEPRWRAMVLLAAYGSLRFGELVGLRRRDVDLLDGVIIVNEQLIELAGRQIRTAPKSDAGRRRVTLPAFVVGELARHIDTYVGPGPDSPLFAGHRGGVPTRTNWARTWTKARRQAGLPPNIHLHDLRHAGATLAAQTGATTKELMARLGHASPRAALIYQHATEDRDRAIADSLDQLIRAKPPSSRPSRAAR
jgi:integrase